VPPPDLLEVSTPSWSGVQAESPALTGARPLGRGASLGGVLVGSLLLHVALLALGLRWAAPAVIPVANSSPLGALQPPEVAVALMDGPIDLPVNQPDQAPQDPLEPAAARPELADESSGAVAVARPASHPVPAPPKPAVAAQRPTPVPRPALPRRAEPRAVPPPSPGSEQPSAGEDWLSMADQLEPVAAERPEVDPVAAPDPLIERLMAAERRKAQLRRQSAATDDAQAVSRPAPPPERPNPAPAARSAVVDLPVALTRWLSEQAPSNPHWLQLGMGTSRAELSVQLSRGHVDGYGIEPGASDHLKQVLTGALFYLAKRQLPGGSVHPPSTTLRVVVEARITPDAATGDGEQLPAIRHFTDPDGGYLPKARVRLASGRRIDIAVSLRP
jgi:hypothetical protein